jgi:hypothetical protein
MKLGKYTKLAGKYTKLGKIYEEWDSQGTVFKN